MSLVISWCGKGGLNLSPPGAGEEVLWVSPVARERVWTWPFPYGKRGHGPLMEMQPAEGRSRRQSFPVEAWACPLP